MSLESVHAFFFCDYIGTHVHVSAWLIGVYLCPLCVCVCVFVVLWGVCTMEGLCIAITNIELRPTTSKQSTLKIEKCLFWDPDPSPSLPSRTNALPVSPLGKLSKRLGPQVEVNQRGFCILQWWGQPFYLAHTNKLCTRFSWCYCQSVRIW